MEGTSPEMTSQPSSSEEHGSGYVKIQGTQPSTLGYSLYDNPVGILSWILEKYYAWSDPRCPAFNDADTNAFSHLHISDEDTLTTVMIYYLTNTIHTSFLPYKELEAVVGSKAKAFWVFALQVRGDRGTEELADVKYRLNWQFYKMHDFGGHFAALDNPDALVGDMQEFANKIWPGF
ncbi:related to Epoxide hydrolase 1 [Ustilago sp. UG-2017b]|nr:related to Epoxide hydrolase 1 [Ustilago sp. UG-2017b]